MTIVNFDNDPINACAVFEYRGYVVSCSAFRRKNNVETVVFLNDETVFTANGVGNALDWIDSIWTQEH